MDGKKHLKWFNSLLFRIPLVLLLLLAALVVSVMLAMKTIGKARLEEQAYRLVAQTGNTIVTDVYSRTVFAESLVKSLANMGEQLPLDVETHMKIIPKVMNIEGTESFIAGGGIWPEPYKFSKNIERHSFFWGRDERGKLQYYDNYNDPNGPGYHNEEWYVPAKHISDDRDFWSKSYMDPYSYQPMVTCTAPMYRNGEFYGVATIDFKLEGLGRFLEQASSRLGGYSFVVDRNGKFLSFPDEKKVKIYPIDNSGNKTEEFIQVEDLSGTEPLFKPIADAILQVNNEITEQVAKSGTSRFNDKLITTIDEESYQINRQEAVMINAALADPLKDMNNNFLLKQFTIKNDLLLGKPCSVFIFHVPNTYWKVVTVMPISEAIAASTSIYRTILLLIIGIITAVMLAGFVVLYKSFISPLSFMSKQLQKAVESNAETPEHINISNEDELGWLAHWFNQRSDQLADTLVKLNEARLNLEKRVEERTKDLTSANKQLEDEIAERKIVQDKLRESENRYHLIFDRANDSILLMNGDKFVDCNEKTLEIFACTREQIIGKPPYLFSPPTQPDGRNSMEKALEKINAALAGQPQKFEWVHSKYDGTEFFAEVTLNVFSLKEQMHILAIVRDITERKKAEEEIKKSRTTLKIIIDSMPFGVMIVDKNRTIRLVNNKAIEMAGCDSGSELIGKICHHFICSANHNNCPVLDKHLNIDKSERILLTKGGRQVPVIKSVIPIIFDNEEVLLESFVDISERKQAEETMKQLNESLEDANNELKNFVYIASHDLREPLRKITAFGSMLEKSIKDKIAGDDAENLHFMIDGAARMTKMIEGLLMYSRVSSQAQSSEVVDLNEIINQLRQLELSMVLQEKQAVISVPNPLPYVEVDPTHIRQLMQNLIANGIKYQKKDNIPHITITAKPAADGIVRIEVTDNGIGIKPEYQQSMFIMFKRLHSNKEYEGTGIGLAVCKKIVERYGGQIGIDSEPDKGSTFWFTLPAAEKMAYAGI